MAEWLPTLFFLAFIFLTVVPILVAGLIEYRKERVETPATTLDPLAAAPPVARFFSTPAPDEAAVRALGDAIVAGIQAHLRREQEVVAEFVAEPSFSSLHRVSRRSVRPASVERHLAREFALVDAFVSNPSVESLHRRWNGHTALN